MARTVGLGYRDWVKNPLDWTMTSEEELGIWRTTLGDTGETRHNVGGAQDEWGVANQRLEGDPEQLGTLIWNGKWGADIGGGREPTLQDLSKHTSAGSGLEVTSHMLSGNYLYAGGVFHTFLAAGRWRGM